jgi:hypothetical protein
MSVALLAGCDGRPFEEPSAPPGAGDVRLLLQAGDTVPSGGAVEAMAALSTASAGDRFAVATLVRVQDHWQVVLHRLDSTGQPLGPPQVISPDPPVQGGTYPPVDILVSAAPDSVLLSVQRLKEEAPDAGKEPMGLQPARLHRFDWQGASLGEPLTLAEGQVASRLFHDEAGYALFVTDSLFFRSQLVRLADDGQPQGAAVPLPGLLESFYPGEDEQGATIYTVVSTPATREDLRFGGQRVDLHSTPVGESFRWPCQDAGRSGWIGGVAGAGRLDLAACLVPASDTIEDAVSVEASDGVGRAELAQERNVVKAQLLPVGPGQARLAYSTWTWDAADGGPGPWGKLVVQPLQIDESVHGAGELSAAALQRVDLTAPDQAPPPDGTPLGGEFAPGTRPSTDLEFDAAVGESVIGFAWVSSNWYVAPDPSGMGSPQLLFRVLPR